MLLSRLNDAGFEIVGDVEADIVIINTCGFIGDAKKEAVDTILDVCQLKSEGVVGAVVVTGCLAERYRDDVTEEIPEVDVCVGIGANSDIADIVINAIEGRGQNRYGEKEDLDLNGERILGGPFYTAYLKIIEPAQPVLELKLVVPNRQVAKDIYKKWGEKAADVYRNIYENLVD